MYQVSGGSKRPQHVSTTAPSCKTKLFKLIKTSGMRKENSLKKSSCFNMDTPTFLSDSNYYNKNNHKKAVFFQTKTVINNVTIVFIQEKSVLNS